MKNQELVSKLVEFVKWNLVEKILKAADAVEELRQENEKNGYPESTPDKLTWLNAHMHFACREEYGDNFKRIFVNRGMHSENWEVMLNYDDSFYHFEFEETCLFVLDSKEVTTYSKVEG